MVFGPTGEPFKSPQVKAENKLPDDLCVRVTVFTPNYNGGTESRIYFPVSIGGGPGQLELKNAILAPEQGYPDAQLRFIPQVLACGLAYIMEIIKRPSWYTQDRVSKAKEV